MEQHELDQITEAIRGGFNAQQNSTPSRGATSGGAGPNFGKIGENIGKDFSKIVSSAGGRVSDAIDNTASTFGSLIGYIEDTQDTFRSLSKVGAGFDADLGALRSSAALTRMPLDKFAGMIAQNTAELAGFAGGVNAGAKRFTRLADEMFSTDLIDRFMNLGLTIEESNEFLMANMAMDRRANRLNGIGAAAQVQSALKLAKTFDVIAKLTGKDVKAQQDDLKERMRDGATSAKIRLLERNGVTGASLAYKASQAALQSAPKVVGDLLADLTQTGVPMTEATKNFAATNAEAYKLLQQSAAATKRGDIGKAEELAAKAAAATAAYADSNQGLTIATLAQVSSIAEGQAERLREMSPLIDALAEHNAKLGTGVATTAEYITAYNDILKNAVEVQDSQLSGTLPGQQTSEMVNLAQRKIADAASNFNQALGGTISSPGIAQGLFQDSIELTTKVINGMTIAGETFIKLIGGNENQMAAEVTTGENSKNFAILADPLSTIAAKSTATEALIKAGLLNPKGEIISVRIAEIEQSLFNSGVKPGFIPDGATSTGELGGFKGWIDKINPFNGGGSPNALGGNVSAGDFLKVGEQGPETMIAGFDGAVIPNMKQMMNRLPQAIESMNLPPSAAEQSVLANMGMKDNDIAALVQQAQTTNELLSRLLGVNTAQGRIGEKHLKLSRGAGNLMTGLGRA